LDSLIAGYPLFLVLSRAHVVDIPNNY